MIVTFQKLSKLSWVKTPGFFMLSATISNKKNLAARRTHKQEGGS